MSTVKQIVKETKTSIAVGLITLMTLSSLMALGYLVFLLPLPKRMTSLVVLMFSFEVDCRKFRKNTLRKKGTDSGKQFLTIAKFFGVNSSKVTKA